MAWKKFIGKSTKHSEIETGCNCYERLDDNIEFYSDGESFVDRCQKQSKKTKGDSLQNLFKGYYQSQLAILKKGGKEIKEHNTFTEHDRSVSPLEGPNSKQNQALLMRRRNAICEKSIEERYGLTLYVQYYSLNHYMESFEKI